MANKVRGEVDVELDGNTYTLRPSWQVVEKIERELGGVLGIMNRVKEGNVRIDEIAFIIYAGLEGNKTQKTPSFKDVHQIVFDTGFVNYISVVSSFLVGAVGGSKNIGEAEEKGGKPPEKKQEETQTT